MLNGSTTFYPMSNIHMCMPGRVMKYVDHLGWHGLRSRRNYGGFAKGGAGEVGKSAGRVRVRRGVVMRERVTVGKGVTVRKGTAVRKTTSHHIFLFP
jgi:hypothetical protein